MRKKSEGHFNFVTMFAFCRAILLMGMGTRNLVSDPYAFKEGVLGLILATPVSLDSLYLAAELSFYQTLKFIKNRKIFRLVSQQIEPSEFTMIINKTNIV